MAEIQRKTIKQSGRNPASRLLHAKNDRETIATWKFDLNRILRVFNVRPVAPVWLLLTAHFQTELAMNTQVLVSDVHYGVIDTHAMVSDVHHGVVNTHSMVSDIHRNMMKGQEGTNGQLRSVSDIRINGRRRLDANEVSDLNCQRTRCLIFASSTPGESPLPQPRGFFGRDDLIERLVGL